MIAKVITIDGPAASGKGTVAKLLAKKLKFAYLDSGGIYRAVALYAINQKIKSDMNKILKNISNIEINFLDNKVYLNDKDVTEEIRHENVGMLASKLAKNKKIRSKLLNFQRSFAKTAKGLVTDGRDMGSIVFPNAILKVFLTASCEVRANRRYKELQNLGKSVKISDILNDITIRDKQDSNRKVAPLMHDDSFRLLDNSHLNIEDTVKLIFKWYKEKIR